MASSEPARVDWSALPSAVLDLISRRITINDDYVRFRAVCTSWRSATTARPRHLPCQLPWLALPFPEASDVCRFLSLPNRKIHSTQLPAARGSHCCGSSFGWLAFLDTSITLFLLNPLTRERIPLPPLNSVCNVPEKVAAESGGGYVFRVRPGVGFSCDFEFICRYIVNRFVLSSDPTSAGCVAMASFCDGVRLAFCRPGVASSWTSLTRPVASFQDSIFYRGRFCVVDTHLVVDVYDVRPMARFHEFPCSEDYPPDDIIRPRIESCLVQGRRRSGGLIERVYLVECRGDLLVVVMRTYDDIFALPYDGDEGHLKLAFEVFKLDLSGEQPQWVELESLGDTALFLGPGSSLSLSAGDFPGGCRGNCIYFSDYPPERHAAIVLGGPDFGVFHFGDGHVERVPCCPVDPGSVWQPSIWITPSLSSSSCWG